MLLNADECYQHSFKLNTANTASREQVVGLKATFVTQSACREKDLIRQLYCVIAVRITTEYHLPTTKENIEPTTFQQF